MKETARNTELLTSKVTYGSVTNDSNRMEIVIDKEEEEDGNECFDECFDEYVLDLRRKIKWEVSLEQTKKRKFTMGYNHGKLNVLPSNYRHPLMTCSQLIPNWLLGSVSENVPSHWTLSSKEVKHINNGMIMWNIMKCFMSEVKRLAIDKVYWK